MGNSRKRTHRSQRRKKLLLCSLRSFAANCCNTLTKVRARTTKIWGAVTCHRFNRFGGLSPRRGRVQRCVETAPHQLHPAAISRLLPLSGTRTRSAHSKPMVAASAALRSSALLGPWSQHVACGLTLEDRDARPVAKALRTGTVLAAFRLQLCHTVVIGDFAS